MTVTQVERTADFLSLAAAKTKKKKPQKIPLFELNNPTPAKCLTNVDLMLLPTSPRERTAKEREEGFLGLILGLMILRVGYRRRSAKSNFSNMIYGFSVASAKQKAMAWRRFTTLLRQRTDDINDGGDISNILVNASGFGAYRQLAALTFSLKLRVATQTGEIKKVKVNQVSFVRSKIYTQPSPFDLMEYDLEHP
ncbi:hypothetical protein TEA_014312 [Camellia sinensis var. sinensis]|uniref:Uncharacterized protein n=1 Tax=Camellia sinensis var. sinensis TaxID=542762 RepID=A0A4S4ED96_CAMSN|nr:hypothetical protein TEA_014312 [Camellia sinensis var. sinensis]